MLKKSYKATIFASCIGYVTQAIIINLFPLLFVRFTHEFGISLAEISILIFIGFSTQLLIDFIGSKYIIKLGYRKSMAIANIFSSAGLIAFAILPYVMPNKYVAILLSLIISSIGGGFIEVLISPIVEACPTKNKSGMMSLLHSFYSWGQVLVILVSTLFFVFVGIENWRVLALIWAIVPSVNFFLFLIVPINTLPEEENGTKYSSLLKNKIFWIFVVMMLCAGASEQAMSQWASAFAEAGLGVEKWLGDLLGPCMFAVCMGVARLFYAKKSEKINLEKGILISAAICIASYLIVILSPVAIVSLIGCALCGIGCGMLWPGTYSLATQKQSKGGVPMFGLLAIAGDLGCLAGPTIAGQISGAFENNMKAGFAAALVFPVLLVIMVIVLFKVYKKQK